MRTLNQLMQLVRKYGKLPHIVASPDYQRFYPILEAIFPSSVNSAGDPFYDNVVSLLHFDGNLTDVKGNTWIAAGNAEASGVAKFGSNALWVDGVGDYVLTSSNLADFSFGTGDFTIEMWIKPVSNTTFYVLCGGPINGDFLIATHVPISGTPTIGIARHNVAWDSSFIGALLSTEAYQHVAVTRASGVARCFIGGTQIGGDSVNTQNYTITSEFRLATNSNSNNFNGVIDEFRVTKGVARYTTNFTPPTTAFPNL